MQNQPSQNYNKINKMNKKSMKNKYHFKIN